MKQDYDYREVVIDEFKSLTASGAVKELNARGLVIIEGFAPAHPPLAGNSECYP
jgi:hypothetical protein